MQFVIEIFFYWKVGEGYFFKKIGRIRFNRILITMHKNMFRFSEKYR